MGIRHLNKFLQKNCINAIKEINLLDLRNKTIVIDISIYLYKFTANNSLIESLFLMISLFRKYNISPLFIFDGKPPTEKNETLWVRKQIKQNAEKEYKILNEKLLTTENIKEKEIIQESMNILKKKFIRLKNKDIELAKKLIIYYGVSYIEAPYEADELCANMVINNKAFACLSEDMDLFVYGCPRVLRYFSLVNCSLVLYDLKLILDKLDFSQDQFKQICILSTNDYNTKKQNNLFTTIKYFDKFKKNNSYTNFINYLSNETNYIEQIDEYNTINELFNLKKDYLKSYTNICIVNGPIHFKNLKEILYQDNFIFVN